MTESVGITVDESSRTAEARRVARKMAADLGFDDSRAEKVAIVVTEACTNILKHAGTGQIVLSSDGASDLEVLALDQGPGMSSIEKCRTDGFSTGGTQGNGLGAISRLSDATDFYSVPGKGSAVLARWSGPHTNGRYPLRVGAVNISKQGEDVCGDAWGIEQTQESATVLLADGLGHGYEASIASLAAVRTLHRNPGLTPLALIERSHEALRSSRGAAVAVAKIDYVHGTVKFSGLGNVAALIYSGAISAQHLVSVNGTAGHTAPQFREFSYPWPENGMLVMHSDGLSTRTGLDAQPRLALHDPSLIAGVLYRDFSRGRDDATVVVAKAA